VFLVYQEQEPAAFDSNRSFQGSKSFITQDPHDAGTQVTLNWKNAITRSFSSDVLGFPDWTPPLPDVVEPSIGDFVFELNSSGTKFISGYRPGNPVMQLGTFVGELRDIPRIPLTLHKRGKFFSELGSEYLNVEFGWKPFLNDLVGMYKLQQTIKSRLERLVRDNGLSIRKRSKKRVTTDLVTLCQGILSTPWGSLGDPSTGGNTLLDGYNLCGPFGVGNYFGTVGQADYRYDIRTITTDWEIGTFKYYVPDIGSDQWTARAIGALFGAKPTPSSLWQIMPWSWLIDWFSNVGDILSNLSSNAVDNETLTNCFAMKTVNKSHIVTVSNSWDGQTGSGYNYPAGSGNPVYSRLELTKMRQQASPFGFGLSWPDFTPRQLAILAALAVSRK
jgi:hypothetical protein